MPVSQSFLGRISHRAVRALPLGLIMILCLGGRPGFAEPPQPSGHWPQFRGPTRDLISTDTGLLANWPESGPPLRWKAGGLGEGYSSVSVIDGRIYTQGHIAGQEKLLVLDEGTGQLIWSVPLGPAVQVGHSGSRCTPTVVGKRLYMETTGGDVVCLDANTQQVIWRRHLIEDFDGRMRNWGFGESLLIDGDRVVCTPGSPTAAMVALGRGDGRVLWKVGSPDVLHASYATPVVIETGSVRQYVQYFRSGLMGVAAESGRILWREQASVNQYANISSPVYRDGFLFSASAYRTGGALFKLVQQEEGVVSELVYEIKHMKSHHGGFVLVDGHIYGTDEAILTCLEFQTGQRKWRDRSVGKGAVVYADGHIYLRSEAGEVALVRATPEGYQEVGRFSQPDRSDRPAWPYPVVTGGQLYLRDQDNLLCYDLRGKTRN